MWEMYYDVEKYRRRKQKFKEVDLNPVYVVYKEWLTEEEEEEEEELRQKKFWENLKDLSQIPKEQPLQSMPETSQEDFRETTALTEEATEPGSCCRKLEGKIVIKTASQQLGRLASRPTVDSEGKFYVSDSTEDRKDPEPLQTEKGVIKARVPFARKRLDLSIYTFDEPCDDDIIEEASDDLIEVAKEDYTDGEESMKKANKKKRRCKLKKAKSKEERSLAKLLKKLSSSLNPLKRTHWNSGKRSRGWYRRKKVTLLTVVNFV
jgi:hypothetical protein